MDKLAPQTGNRKHASRHGGGGLESLRMFGELLKAKLGSRARMAMGEARILPVARAVAVGLLFVCGNIIASQSDHSRPNVVLILADDMGYGDLHCYQPSSPFATPALDQLAAEGRRYVDAHTPSAVCSPTRYGLLTGRYAWRTRLKRGVLDGFDPPLIDCGRRTLATLLRDRGYVTAGFGKWHVGMTWLDRDGRPLPVRTEGDFRPGTNVDYSRAITGGPWDCGFQQYFGIAGSLDMPPYAFLENRRVVGTITTAPEAKDLFLNQAPGVTTEGFRLEEVLPTLTRKVTNFISDRGRGSDPFFVYFALPSPHLPVVPSAAWLGKSGAGRYADFMQETDAAVGEVLASLKQVGLADNTLVIFTSDNGGLWHEWVPREADDVAGHTSTERGLYNAERGHRSNAGLRGTKADIFEGGHRVPFIARWPARVRAGQVSEALVELNDIYATIAEITASPLARDEAEDSFSFLGELVGATPSQPVRTFAVHHSIRGVFALREGAWKLVPERGSGGFSTPRQITAKPKEASGQLYDLSVDPAETRNVWLSHPETVAQMQAKLESIKTGNRTRP